MDYSPYQRLASIYDAIRPGYPAELVQDIVRQAKLDPTFPMLEIGAGTGKATEAFLSLGYSVDAVELEASMAELLRKRLASPKLRLYVSAFESWEAPRRDYAVILCAQAFHWLDKAVRFQRCRELLAPNGHLVLIWYTPLPSSDSAAARESQRIKAQYFGAEPTVSPVFSVSREQELRKTDDFIMTFQRQYDVVLHNTPEQALMAMQSTPAFAEQFCRLTSERQQRFLQDFSRVIMENGGYLESPLRYELYILAPTSN